jgi:hypothetical protein
VSFYRINRPINRNYDGRPTQFSNLEEGML